MRKFLRNCSRGVALRLVRSSGCELNPTSYRRMSSLHGRTYAQAEALLESLQSNRAVVESVSSSAEDMNLRAIPEMIEWTRKAGYEVGDFHSHGLRCIHVAGTKGKGSVCALTENILMQYRRKDDNLGEGSYGGIGRIGLYTSPHLVEVRERIRIDGSAISKDLFAMYFFQLWDRFSKAVHSTSQDTGAVSVSDKPGYFRFLTILALHAFVQEGVDTAIIECGIGGEYDSTNILPVEAVTVTAITKLGIDHIGMLGDTIEQIAWHKAGIMKKGVPAYTVLQIAEAQQVLEKRAAEKEVELAVVDRIQAIEDGEITLGLGGDFQVDNASLAVTIATSHLQSLGVADNIPQSVDHREGDLPRQFKDGLQTAQWPGRCQTIIDDNIEWWIDGAHTLDSILVAADWYKSKWRAAIKAKSPPNETMLIFNQQDRDARKLLTTLMIELVKLPLHPPRVFRYGAFCTNTPFQAPKFEREAPPDLKLQRENENAYRRLDANQMTMSFASIEEAVLLARRVAKGHQKFVVFVTGSLYLVGGLLKVLASHSSCSADELERKIDQLNNHT